MSVPIVICDDSNMARKQLKRCLPKDWDVDITFTENGEEAIKALEQGLGEVLFLDLTMPVMDGYETLEAIRAHDLDTMVIVVSGDVQQEAYRRVISLGAMDFIKKPAESALVSDILSRFGIHREGKLAESADVVLEEDEIHLSSSDMEARFDAYRELTNVAIGRAADLLSKLIGEFVNLPIPRVNLLEVSELKMALHFSNEENVSAVCQGFIAPGIAGEALLVFSDSSFEDMAGLMHHEGSSDIEVLTDVAGVLLGSILNGLGQQLHLNFTQSSPSVLGVHSNAQDLINSNATKWKKTLAIEVNYEIPSRSISCDVLLLFTEGSMDKIDERIV